MTLRKTIKAGLLKDIIKLPDDIQEDTLVEITVREVHPAGVHKDQDDHKKTFEEMKNLFESRIRAASTQLNFTEEVFLLDEVEWQDLNEIKSYFESQGYGVRIDQQDQRVRIKILWRYA